MPRRLVNFQSAAVHLSVSERTIRNYIGRGFFPAYKVAGRRGFFVDLNEVNAAMASTSGARAIAGQRRFGPKAKIIDLPARPEVVEP